jgi:hypothetical protein
LKQAQAANENISFAKELKEEEEIKKKRKKERRKGKERLPYSKIPP